MGHSINVLVSWLLVALCAVVMAESGEPAVATSNTNLAPLPSLPSRQKPKVENQWRTYLHTNEGLTRDGLMEDTGKVTLAGGNSLSTVSRLRLSEEQLPEYGPSFGLLTVEATPETATRLHVKIYPVNQPRWEVPESIVPRPKAQQDLGKGNLVYDFSTSHQQHTGSGSEAFSMEVTRRSSGATLFDTTGYSFIFKDQYIEFTTKIPKHASITGLGHINLPSVFIPREGNPITLWARDQPGTLTQRYANLHGSHPFYMQVGADGFAHGVLFLNSNGMDVVMKEQSITFKAIGGIVDLYFFMGPYPEDVMMQYQEVIGKPGMPPYWALGSHHANWGANLSAYERALETFSAAEVPVEALWTDSSAMDSSLASQPRMKAFITKLHSSGRSWIPKQDAAVVKDPSSKAYTDGLKDNIWINDYKGQPYLGQTAAGEVFWPDYLSNPKTVAWLSAQMKNLSRETPFDGLWMDITEAMNQCSGIRCKADPAAASQATSSGGVCQLKCEQASAANLLSSPPYAIHNYDANSGANQSKLDTNIVSVTAKNSDGSTQYNTHNLYGASMAKAHFEAFTAATGKRPFNVIRSSFPGAGRYAGLWMADTRPSWSALADSVASMLVPSMWGISMVGPDVCAFLDVPQTSGAGKNSSLGADTVDESEYAELCARWTSASAFYPFARTHVNYKWPAVAAAAKKALGLRYQLLSYMYTSLQMAHSRGGTFARPLMFVDAADILARNSDTQWMLGEALLVSPVLTKNTTSHSAHFPKGNWYSAWDHQKQAAWPVGKSTTLDTPIGDIAVHYRGGAIIPKQQYANNTRDVRYSPVTLVVTLPAELSVAPKGYVKQAPTAPSQTKPAPGQPKPTPGQTKPAAGHPKPTPDQTKPAAGHPKPTPGQTQPAAGHPKPTPGQTQPATGHPKPTPGQSKPASGHLEPTPGQSKTAFGHPKPTPRQSKPVSGQPKLKAAAGSSKPAAAQRHQGTGSNHNNLGRGSIQGHLNAVAQHRSPTNAQLPAESAVAAAAITPATADRLLIARPPYATVDVCATAHAENAGNYVSCGPIYMDADNVDTSSGKNVQVWYTAITAPDTRSGSITSSILANSGAAKERQVKIEAVNILGVTLPDGVTPGKVKARVNNRPARAEFDAKSGVLVITGFEAVVAGPFEVSWSMQVP